MDVEAKSGSAALLIAGRVVLSIFLLSVTSVIISVLITLNAAIGMSIVWFPIALVAFSVAYYDFTRRYIVDLSYSGNAKSRVWWVVVVMLPIVTLLGLLLTGWDNVVEGHVTMRGDSFGRSPLFALSASLLMPAAAGVAEEVSVRGYLQCPLMASMSSLRAQVIAGGVFIIMHGSQLMEMRRLVFLVTLAAVCGFLTSMSGRIGPAVFFHSAVNFAMACTVLLYRS